MLVSKKRIECDFGFTSQMITVYVQAGHLTDVGGNVVYEDAEKLEVDKHYVVCQICQRKLIALGSHAHRCAEPYTIPEYEARFPGCKTQSEFGAQRRIRTEAMKEHQSKTLIARFKTPEGQITKQQISKRAKEVMDAGYKIQAGEHLRKLNADPEQRAARGRESQERWDNDPEFRAKHAKWIAENIDSVHASIAHATTFLTKKSTKLHLRMRDALVEVGVQGMQTEYQHYWYSIDEAIPEFKIAIEVDGCYWHGCTVCNLPGVEPTRNVDSRKTTFLRNGGWTLIRIPEHEIEADIERCALEVKALIDEIKEQKNANL